MEESKRNGWILALGLLVVGLVAGWAISTWLAQSHGSDPAPVSVVPASEPAPAAQAAASAAPAAQVAAAAPTACAFEPLVANAGKGDGQFVLASALAAQQFTDGTPFLAVADEAARAGRSRDAEVALIAACQVAARSGALSAPVADAQGRLANHYATLGSREPEGPVRAALLDRAGQLLDESFQGYVAALGEQSSRARTAQQRLAAFRQGAIAPTTSAGAGSPSGSTSTMGAARLSLADRPLRADESLSEADHDLQRLYEQARAVTRDPAGLARRQQQAVAARNACPDEACMRQWYAQRKRQLFDEF
ncbi:hypothetical protein LZ009_09105 [Ramlibacter sp. XY19]|uniref:hypothetical protein n=1 Tax=Ramlibacter paludis TaxID=2908000 RepID=UPI0023DAE9D9|nr:hypothetical protein [Ramlibacter paludis]MCG2592937.1 hypothetical protein [Ramlibacter paludis]